MLSNEWRVVSSSLFVGHNRPQLVKDLMCSFHEPVSLLAIVSVDFRKKLVNIESVDSYFDQKSYTDSMFEQTLRLGGVRYLPAFDTVQTIARLDGFNLQDSAEDQTRATALGSAKAAVVFSKIETTDMEGMPVDLYTVRRFHDISDNPLEGSQVFTPPFFIRLPEISVNGSIPHEVHNKYNSVRESLSSFQITSSREVASVYRTFKPGWDRGWPILTDLLRRFNYDE